MRIRFEFGGIRTGMVRAGREISRRRRLVREIELLAPAQVTLLADRRKLRPWGLEGGEDGAAGRAVLRKRRDGRGDRVAGEMQFRG